MRSRSALHLERSFRTAYRSLVSSPCPSLHTHHLYDQVKRVFRHVGVCGSLPVVIERMELGLLPDVLFCRGLDGDKICQVELEEEDTVLSCLLLELFDRLL